LHLLVQKLFVCFLLCLQLIFYSNACQRLKQGWMAKWLPWSFTNPMWQSDNLSLHWSVMLPLCFRSL